MEDNNSFKGKIDRDFMYESKYREERATIKGYERIIFSEIDILFDFRRETKPEDIEDVKQRIKDIGKKMPMTTIAHPRKLKLDLYGKNHKFEKLKPSIKESLPKSKLDRIDEYIRTGEGSIDGFTEIF